MNDAWRLCGDEDDLRVSWLGRFTRFLLRRLAMLLVFFVWCFLCLLLFVLVVGSVAVWLGGVASGVLVLFVSYLRC